MSELVPPVPRSSAAPSASNVGDREEEKNDLSSSGGLKGPGSNISHFQPGKGVAPEIAEESRDGSLETGLPDDPFEHAADRSVGEVMDPSTRPTPAEAEPPDPQTKLEAANVN